MLWVYSTLYAKTTHLLDVVEKLVNHVVIRVATFVISGVKILVDYLRIEKSITIHPDGVDRRGTD